MAEHPGQRTTCPQLFSARHRQRTIGNRQPIPLGLTGIPHHYPVIAQLVFQPAGDVEDMVPHRDGAVGGIDRQHLVEQLCREIVGDQAGPCRLKLAQFGTRPLRE